MACACVVTTKLAATQAEPERSCAVQASSLQKHHLPRFSLPVEHQAVEVDARRDASARAIAGVPRHLPEPRIRWVPCPLLHEGTREVVDAELGHLRPRGHLEREGGHGIEGVRNVLEEVPAVRGRSRLWESGDCRHVVEQDRDAVAEVVRSHKVASAVSVEISE